MREVGEPIRPLKLRLPVDKHTSSSPSVPWWRPMHGPQPAELAIAPDSIRVARVSSCAARRISRSDAGVTIIRMVGAIRRPRSRSAAGGQPGRRHRWVVEPLALLASLGIGQADLFGYSLGAGIALNIITNHPAVVRKAVLASVTYDKTGLRLGARSQPGL